MMQEDDPETDREREEENKERPQKEVRVRTLLAFQRRATTQCFASCLPCCTHFRNRRNI